MIRIALILGVACMLHGCYGTYRATARGNARLAYTYSTPSAVYVREPPPPIHQARPQPPAPSAQSVWVAGHWSWQGRWVWIDGSWQTPRAGHVWTPPVAVRAQGGRYEYHPGYWRRPQVAPPPVYQHPGTVRVSVAPSHVVVRGRATHPVHPSQNVRVAPGRPNTVVQPTGTVRATPNQPTPPGGHVVVQPGRPNVTTTGATPRPATPAATVRPGMRPATVAPGGQATVTAGQRPVSATPAGGRVTATAGARPVTATPSGRVTATAGSRPANVTPAGGTATAGARPVTVTPAGQATATVGGRAPVAAVPVTATAAGRTANAGMATLRCAMNTTIAPRGGYLTLTGSGFWKPGASDDRRS